ncbi:MAG: trypsin-like peptidase domain-containing protein [Alphaproteobacteria bacterium]|nr:trypsin-like peptidase domain-containing protein [Alphaproteobacteria bacterium]
MFFRTFLLVLLYCFNAFAQTSLAPIVQKVIPSVVSISVALQETVDAPEVQESLVFKKDENVALGSGFIADEQGYVLTNRHVVEKAKNISVKTFEGKTYAARLVGEDEVCDVALLKIEADTSIKAAEFADSDALEVGDRILAVGNPFGLENSVTTGIVSAKSRNINETPFDDYIQTDAPITQGNSGGAMFDMQGKVVGLNTLIFSKQGSNLGVGFALPSNQLVHIYQALKTTGKVLRSYLGVDLKESLTGDGQKVLAVSEILDETLAFDNNLIAGDMIVEVDGKKIESLQKFKNFVSWLKPETELTLKILRQGEEVELLVQTQLMPYENIKETQKEEIGAENGVFYGSIGLKLDGFDITDVQNESEAAAKGVKKGDKLVGINGFTLSTPDDFALYLQESIEQNKRIRLELKDGDDVPYFVELTPVGEK